MTGTERIFEVALFLKPRQDVLARVLEVCMRAEPLPLQEKNRGEIKLEMQ